VIERATEIVHSYDTLGRTGPATDAEDPAHLGQRFHVGRAGIFQQVIETWPGPAGQLHGGRRIGHQGIPELGRSLRVAGRRRDPHGLEAVGIVEAGTAPAKLV
jgi:hypothetical protein